LAKSLVDETSDNFIGLYIGSVTPSATVKSLIESSDLVLHVGKFPSDTNTGGFTQKLAETCSIVLHPEHVKIKNVMLKNVSFVPIVQKLARQFSQTPGLSNAGWWKTVCLPSLSLC
jgi:pyruvate decarboxylase